MRGFVVASLWCLATVAGGCAATDEGPGFDYAIEFEGSASFGDGPLEEAIADDLVTFEESRGSKAAVDDMAWVLERFLKDEGFPFARVDYEWEKSPGFVRARFLIEEGPRTRIESLTLEGVESYEPENLIASFVRGERLFGDRYYVESVLASAVTDILRFYRSRGYLDVSADEPVVVFADDRSTATVTLRFDEGTAYVVRAARLELDEELDRSELDRVLATFVNAPFAPRVRQALTSRLLEACADLGRPDARVVVDVDSDPVTGAVELVARIEPGPEVRVGEIRIDGLRKTRDSFIRSRLAFEPGERYSAESVRESFRQLYKSGLFRRVTIELEGEGDVRAAVVRVEELPSLEFWLEPGWGSHELARLTAGVRERNVFGTGRSLSLEVKGAVRAQKAALTLTDPWFFGSDYTMTYTLYGNRRDEQSFTSLEAGIGTDLSRRWNRYWSSSLGYQLRFTALESVDVLSSEAQAFIDDVDIAELITTTTRDTRNDVFIPNDGGLSRLSLEWGSEYLGSELDFLRATFTQSSFIGLGEHTTLGLSMRGGLIAPIRDDDDIPLQERFFNGGENTVRSFREDELGPLDSSGEPLGGEGFSVVSVEVRQRLWGNLGMAVFGDGGNIVQDYEDWLEFPDMRFAVGIGLRYLLPVGPVRLDWGWNPDQHPGEDPWALHFSVGMSF